MCTHTRNFICTMKKKIPKKITLQFILFFFWFFFFVNRKSSCARTMYRGSADSNSSERCHGRRAISDGLPWPVPSRVHACAARIRERSWRTVLRKLYIYFNSMDWMFLWCELALIFIVHQIFTRSGIHLTNPPENFNIFAFLVSRHFWFLTRPLHSYN